MTFKYGATTITYHSANRKDNPKHMSFMESDILGILTNIEEIFVIDNIYTEVASRNLGHATTAVKHFIEKLSPDFPIAAYSGLLMEYYLTEPTEEEYDTVLKWQREFLEKCGFTSINDYVQYEHSEAFLYINEMTQPVMDACEENRQRKESVVTN